MKNIRKKRTRVQKELSVLITPYAKHWKTWTDCKHCFLTEQEVQLVELIEVHGKLITVAKVLKIPPHKISAFYLRIKRKLTSHYPHYKKWVEKLMIVKTENEKPNSPIEKAMFLSASFHSRFFPSHLGKLLAALGEDLFEVLRHYGEKELLMNRGFGKRRLEELRKILKEHDCGYFLSKCVKANKSYSDSD